MTTRRREALRVLPPPESKGRRGSGLTPKMESFCRPYLSTGNAAEAYRLAYNVGPTTRPQTVYVEASRLLNNPKITPWIQELRDQAIAVLHLTPEWVLARLWREIEGDTGAVGKPARVKALELLMRHMDLLGNRRQ